MSSSVILLVLSFLVFTGCTSSVTEPADKTTTTSSASGKEDIQPDCRDTQTCTCDLPNGRTILNGEFLPMFRSAKPGCGISCESQKLEVKCENGNLQLHSQFPVYTCEDTECSGCELPWGERLEEGATISVYKDEVVNCKSSCQVQTVSCTGGRLVGANIISYPYPSCKVEECIECTTPWGDKVSDGASIFGFTSDSVKCGNRCMAKQMLCNLGKFDEIDAKTYTHASCVIERCTHCTTPWGAMLQSGHDVIAYKSSVVGCNKSCFENGNMQPRVCVDGVLTGDANYKYGSCVSELCEEGGGAPGFVCRLPWSGAQALGGTELTAYSKERVRCEDDCDKYQHLRKCRIEDGLFDGPPEAIYSNCTRDCKE